MKVLLKIDSIYEIDLFKNQEIKFKDLIPVPFLFTVSKLLWTIIYWDLNTWKVNNWGQTSDIKNITFKQEQFWWLYSYEILFSIDSLDILINIINNKLWNTPWIKIMFYNFDYDYTNNIYNLERIKLKDWKKIRFKSKLFNWININNYIVHWWFHTMFNNFIKENFCNIYHYKDMIKSIKSDKTIWIDIKKILKHFQPTKTVGNKKSKTIDS